MGLTSEMGASYSVLRDMGTLFPIIKFLGNFCFECSWFFIFLLVLGSICT